MTCRNKKIKKDDCLIITGDFGAIWDGNGKDDKLLNKYAKLPFTILFIDGNHENFDKVYEYPVEDWNGGKIHKIRENVFHLMRGQIFTIEDKTFFTMGGGTSIDKEWRLQYEKENSYKKPVKIWWEQEIPSNEELSAGIVKLKEYNNKVDYIITHTVPDIFMVDYLNFVKEMSTLTHFLDYVFKNVEYEQWFCGHFHVDRSYDKAKIRMVYEDIILV